ncbi:hypothetical protein JTB14_029603 [Gonioctena quinquepunctata]|nr:hypothetical protein JTB14_029603 [Gonioctena quinquepunctata]
MGETWKPNEDFLHQLVSMGITHDIANQALFCTGNESVDQAVEYIFNNQEEGPENVPGKPQNEVSGSEDESFEDEDVQHYKMTFVVNMSLKMGVGKIAAQVGHACLGLYRDMAKLEKQDGLLIWEQIGEKKIVLKGTDELHLKELFEKAKAKNIPCYLIRDAGHTQIAAGSVTVLSLFGLEEDVNEITGKLSLL